MNLLRKRNSSSSLSSDSEESILSENELAFYGHSSWPRKTSIKSPKGGNIRGKEGEKLRPAAGKALRSRYSEQEDQWYNYGKWSNFEDDSVLLNRHRRAKMSNTSRQEADRTLPGLPKRSQARGVIEQQKSSFKDQKDYSRAMIAAQKPTAKMV